MTNSATDVKKPLTIVDVARLLGVSKSTVSAAFTGNGNITAERREAVRRAALELGYEPNPHAQRLVSGRRDDTIALFAQNLDLGVSTRKLQVLQELLNERGFNTPLHVCGRSAYLKPGAQVAMLRSIRLSRPRAIVCNAIALDQAEIDELRRFSEEGGVVVCYDVALDVPCDQVVFDREHNTYHAMRHLLELGHRRIGFSMGSVMRDQAHLPGTARYGRTRLAGLERALREFDAPLLQEWMEYRTTERYEKAGAELGEFFMSRPARPTAMCIVNDNVTVGFMAYVQRHGLRIPEDVSIVSHDDRPIAALGTTVTITTMTQPVETIAQHAANLLLERLDGEYDGPPRRVEVRGELMVRESARALAAT